VIVNPPNDVVLLVPSVPTPLAAMISSEADTYLGLLIVAIFWVFFSGAVVAVSEHEAEEKSAAGWAASFVVASLVGAYFLWMLL
jgi:hypothetical protein